MLHLNPILILSNDSTLLLYTLYLKNFVTNVYVDLSWHDMLTPSKLTISFKKYSLLFR